jgi:polar amino acid transport system substrate-binding protein
MLACGDPKGSVQVDQDTLAKVQSEGKIRAAYFIEPPAVMKDPTTGELSGTFVESIHAIADQLKVKVEFVEVDLSKFAAGLQTGAYDVSIGPTFRTIPRASSCAFTRTIFYLGYDGIVMRGRAKDFPNEAAIDQPGVTVAVKEGSAIHRYAQDNFKKAKVLVLSGTDLSLPLQAVSSGQATVGLMNEHTVEFYHRQHPEVEIILKDKPIQVAGMSWAVRNSDLVWLNFLNTSLEFLESTGQMAQWERKHYFGQVLRHSMPTY